MYKQPRQQTPANPTPELRPATPPQLPPPMPSTGYVATSALNPTPSRLSCSPLPPKTASSIALASGANPPSPPPKPCTRPSPCPIALVVIVSPSARQSGELVHKCGRFATRLGITPRGDGLNEISLVLPNRSRIIGLPGSEKTIRGFSAANLVLVDEAPASKTPSTRPSAPCSLSATAPFGS